MAKKRPSLGEVVSGSATKAKICPDAGVTIDWFLNLHREAMQRIDLVMTEIDTRNKDTKSKENVDMGLLRKIIGEDIEAEIRNHIKELVTERRQIEPLCMAVSRHVLNAKKLAPTDIHYTLKRAIGTEYASIIGIIAQKFVTTPSTDSILRTSEAKPVEIEKEIKPTLPVSVPKPIVSRGESLASLLKKEGHVTPTKQQEFVRTKLLHIVSSAFENFLVLLRGEPFNYGQRLHSDDAEMLLELFKNLQMASHTSVGFVTLKSLRDRASKNFLSGKYNSFPGSPAGQAAMRVIFGTAVIQHIIATFNEISTEEDLYLALLQTPDRKIFRTRDDIVEVIQPDTMEPESVTPASTEEEEIIHQAFPNDIPNLEKVSTSDALKFDGVACTLNDALYGGCKKRDRKFIITVLEQWAKAGFATQISLTNAIKKGPVKDKDSIESVTETDTKTTSVIDTINSEAVISIIPPTEGLKPAPPVLQEYTKDEDVLVHNPIEQSTIISAQPMQPEVEARIGISFTFIREKAEELVEKYKFENLINGLDKKAEKPQDKSRVNAAMLAKNTAIDDLIERIPKVITSRKTIYRYLTLEREQCRRYLDRLKPAIESSFLAKTASIYNTAYDEYESVLLTEAERLTLPEDDGQTTLFDVVDDEKGLSKDEIIFKLIYEISTAYDRIRYPKSTHCVVWKNIKNPSEWNAKHAKINKAHMSIMEKVTTRFGNHDFPFACLQEDDIDVYTNALKSFTQMEFRKKEMAFSGIANMTLSPAEKAKMYEEYVAAIDRTAITLKELLPKTASAATTSDSIPVEEPLISDETTAVPSGDIAVQEPAIFVDDSSKNFGDLSVELQKDRSVSIAVQENSDIQTEEIASVDVVTAQLDEIAQKHREEILRLQKVAEEERQKVTSLTEQLVQLETANQEMEARHQLVEASERDLEFTRQRLQEERVQIDIENARLKNESQLLESQRHNLAILSDELLRQMQENLDTKKLLDAQVADIDIREMSLAGRLTILANEQKAVHELRENLENEKSIFHADIEIREAAMVRERAALDEEKMELEQGLQDLLAAQEEFESDKEEFEAERAAWEEERDAEIDESVDDDSEERDEENDEDNNEVADDTSVKTVPVPVPKKDRIIVAPVVGSASEAVEKCIDLKKQIMNCANVLDKNRASADRIFIAITGLISAKKGQLSLRALQGALGEAADNYIAECQMYRTTMVRRSDLLQELTLFAKEWQSKEAAKKYMATFTGCLTLIQQIEADDCSAQIGDTFCSDDTFYTALENLLLSVKSFPALQHHE